MGTRILRMDQTKTCITGWKDDGRGHEKQSLCIIGITCISGILTKCRITSSSTSTLYPGGLLCAEVDGRLDSRDHGTDLEFFRCSHT
jgi:hypothetical protein